VPLILAALLLTSFSFATTTAGKVDCPVQFEGRVEEFVKGVGTSSAFSTHTVVFKNLSTLKGEVSEQVAIEILENGPFALVRGEDYHVQVRDGRICWIDKI
jgi:hypothetical protein